MPKEHIVQQGETTIGLAEMYGLFADTIWNDPANSKLKQERKDMNVLLPGDKLVIPDKREKQESKASGQRYKFLRKGVPAKLRMQLFEGDHPRANQDYQLVVDGKLFKGKTDGTGVLEATVPTNAQEGHLVVGPDKFEIEIRFGHLNPLSDVTGVQHRLANLGYLPPGGVSGTLDEDTKDAIADFQHRFGLEITGELNDETKSQLDKVYGETGKFKDPPKD